MPGAYTSGDWTVRAGEEDEFIQDWTDFASWGHTMKGAGTFRLVRDTANPNHFLSFAPWVSLDAQRTWRDEPEFAERLERIGSHCEDSRSTTYEVVTEIG